MSMRQSRDRSRFLLETLSLLEAKWKGHKDRVGTRESAALKASQVLIALGIPNEVCLARASQLRICLSGNLPRIVRHW